MNNHSVCIFSTEDILPENVVYHDKGEPSRRAFVAKYPARHKNQDGFVYVVRKTSLIVKPFKD